MKIEEWEKRIPHGISLNSYHMWALGKLARRCRRRFKSDMVGILVEEAAEKAGITVEQFLEERGDAKNTNNS